MLLLLGGILSVGLSGAYLLKVGCRWSVKNGKKVKFLIDKWASQTPLQNTITRPLLDSELNKKVTDYLDMERG